MIQSNYFTDNADLQEHFGQIIDWPGIIELYENGFADAAEFRKTKNPRYEMAPSSVEEAQQYYKEILNSAGEIAGMHVSQAAQAIDREGLKYTDNNVIHPQKMIDVIQKYRDAGLPPIAFRRKYGGLGLPSVVKAMASELMYRADTSTTIAMGSMGLAGILEKHASEEAKEKWIPKMIAENYCVAMGLSEPDFGSDLPSVRTKAVQRDGKWYLTGTKRFQTVACGLNGGPAIMLALARTGEGTTGAKGLSFFIVERKDYKVTGIEKKLGLKASATCEVALEDSPGELVGKEGYGLVRYVIGMLNGARMGIAAQGVGLATAGYMEAKKYAAERIQFGKPIQEIPAVARMLSRMEREIAAMRCLMVEGATIVDRYQCPEFNGVVSDEARYWEKIANTITPISKYYNSEMCNELIDDALQVFGGSGYTEDYDLARLYRDARITNIYDGTTQIQVNAAIGGVIAGMAAQGQWRQYLDSLTKQIGKNDAISDIRARFEEVVEAWRKFEDREVKEGMSFEVVESAARLVNSLLMEKATLRATDKATRAKLNAAYHVDSLATVTGNLIRLRAG
ncbi:MAG: acyl-CoA dehydrogenase family protein [Leptospiraceae bacterium]|nr:acyl-CoA dehydrogenase family protein [Leptospiraceae bacterium]